MTGSTAVLTDIEAPGTSRLASPELFAWISMQAKLTGEFNVATWAKMLLWPTVTSSSPEFYRAFAEHWGEALAVPGRDQSHQHVSECTAAAVLYVILRSMTEDESTREYNCFLAPQTIAARAHNSVRSVRRVLAWQDESPVPLLTLTYPGKTRGRLHKCPRFTLVKFPNEFAAERDARRAGERKAHRRPVRRTASQRAHANHVVCVTPGCCLTRPIAGELLAYFPDEQKLRFWANLVAIAWRGHLAQGVKRSEPNRQAFWSARLAEHRNGTPAQVAKLAHGV